MKIRIAVVMNNEGHWNAMGFYRFDDKTAISCVKEGLDEASVNESIHFVEAEIPVPVSMTVEGHVSDA